MKRSLFALILLAITASPAFPQMRNVMPAWKLKLQNRLTQRISIAVQSTPLVEVVAILRNALNVNVVLDVDDPAVSEMLITLDFKDMPGDKILGWVTRQAGLDYVLADEAVYISVREKTRTIEPMALAEYEITDIVLSPMALAASGSSGSSNSSSSNSSSGGNDSSGNNNNSFSGADAGNDLLTLIVTFTGRENWDQVAVLGASDNNDSENGSTSEDNLF